MTEIAWFITSGCGLLLVVAGTALYLHYRKVHEAEKGSLRAEVEAARSDVAEYGEKTESALREADWYRRVFENSPDIRLTYSLADDQVPDRFITISESMAERLRKRGTTAPIDVVYNGIEVERFTTSKPRPKRDPVLGLIGRIEFNQKQQDFLVRAIADEPRLSLRIVGDGPDRGKLDRLIASLKLQDRITVETWRDDPAAFYQEIDCLVIPSRYEGVPLVMLEALSCGIPVVGSDRDGMRDLLPGTWRFPFGDAAALRRTLNDTLARDNQADLQSLQHRIHESMTLPAFKQNFTRAVLEPAHAV